MAITGTGTQADPWVISTPQDLVDFSASTSYWASGTYAQLGADINMDGVSGFIPIGNNTTKYQGNFDGQGHVISNLTVNLQSTDYVGLFGFVSGTTISRIGCVGFDIKGSNSVGGLVGGASSASISNCYTNDCEVSGSSSFVGGLVGQAGSASGCKFENVRIMYGNVTGSDCVGGLVGYAESMNVEFDGCVVENCVVESGSNYVGGLVGYASSASKFDGCVVENCVVKSGSNYVGGLVGKADSASISNCYTNDCEVSGGSFVGGLVGANSASISNCYTNDCEVSGGSFVGGLVGRAYYASISNCAIYGGTHGNVLVASASGGTITNCYTSNDVSSATFHTKGFWDGTGVSGTTYLSWDFTTPVWYWDSTKQLPVLQPTSSPVPNLKTKINGTWKNASGMFTKVGGAWKQADKAFVKVGGAWKQT